MSTPTTLARQLRAELARLGHPSRTATRWNSSPPCTASWTENTLAARPGTPQQPTEALGGLPRVGVYLTPMQRVQVDFLRGGPLHHLGTQAALPGGCAGPLDWVYVEGREGVLMVQHRPE